MKITGNTVLITGGGTGIGLALTEAFVKRKNRVIICGRRETRIKAVADRFRDVHYRVCDAADPDSRKALIEWILGEFDDLNILVNNAGIQRPINFREGPKDLDQADLEVAVNFLAPVHLSGELIPHFLKKKAAGIINISSGLAYTPLAFVPVYCATKAALHSWTLSLRHQLAGSSIRVYEVAPPMVATELSGRHTASETNDRIMSAADVAFGTLEALEHDRYEVALGAAEKLREQGEVLFPAINQM